MTIGFTQQISGKPNHFVEKILTGLYKDQVIPISKMCELFRDEHLSVDERLRFIDTSRAVIDDYKPKRHTIREFWKNKQGGISDRQIKAGDNLHLVINNRTPKRFQFAPMLKCVGVQAIEIKYAAGYDEFPMVFIDSIPIHDNCNADLIIKQLAINDGFEDIDAFFNYFNKNFTGQIIHWTNLKY